MPSGPQLFRDWMERSKMNNAAASAYLGLDKSVVTKLASGLRSAGLKIAVHLERRTGIPVEAWMSDDADESELVSAGSRRNCKSDK